MLRPTSPPGSILASPAAPTAPQPHSRHAAALEHGHLLTAGLHRGPGGGLQAGGWILGVRGGGRREEEGGVGLAGYLGNWSIWQQLLIHVENEIEEATLWSD